MHVGVHLSICKTAHRSPQTLECIMEEFRVPGDNLPLITWRALWPVQSSQIEIHQLLHAGSFWMLQFT